jgi:hypothetical protein
MKPKLMLYLSFPQDSQEEAQPLNTVFLSQNPYLPLQETV